MHCLQQCTTILKTYTVLPVTPATRCPNNHFLPNTIPLIHHYPYTYFPSNVLTRGAFVLSFDFRPQNPAKKKGNIPMKMELNRKSLRKKTLPGDRQGTSGTGAGRRSMRDVSNQENTGVESDINPTSSQPGLSVNRDAAIRWTTTGGRLRWSREMNAEVVKCFLLTNDCRDDLLTGWRQKLHSEFKKRNPEAEFTEQYLSDRLRCIYNRKLLAQTEIDEIRREMGRQITNRQHMQELEVPEDDTKQHEAVDERLPQAEETECDRIIEMQLRNNILLFQNTDPNNRPCIPKLITKKNTQYIVTQVDKSLGNTINEVDNIKTLHTILYAAIVTVIEMNDQKPFNRNQGTTPRNKAEPEWKKRLTSQIDQLRSTVDIIDEYLKGNTSRKVTTKIKTVTRVANLRATDPQFIDKLKIYRDEVRQKFKAKGARLKRYNLANKRKQQNREFSRNQKNFYRSLENNSTIQEVTKDHDKENFIRYWQDIWEKPTKYNKRNKWVTRIEEKLERLPPMEEINITEDDIKQCLKTLSNWKSPGPDQIHNYWLKTFTCLPKILARCFNETFANPEEFPDYLNSAYTFLLFKKGDKNDPKNFRPITCLSVVYKLLTAVIHSKIYKHCTSNNIIAIEQKGCIKKSLGCKEQLTIDAVVMKHAQRRKRNLNMCYIDYCKAYDSVPHDWLQKVLEIYKIHPKIRNLLNILMHGWNTRLHVNGEMLGQIKITRGIFQGDTLSPLWFVLALNPLSSLLNDTSYGFRMDISEDIKLNHIMFMDDIKLFAESKKHMQSLINTTRIFSNDIGMSFGLDKCATVSIRQGRITHEGLEDEISPLPPQETYKYLGMAQNGIMDHTTLKKQFKEKYRQRLTKLLNTTLNARNLITAINTWAVPTLIHSFGILKYTKADLDELDRMTRRLMKKFRIHHPKAAVERVYLPRQQGGRGLINIAELCRKQEHSIREYFHRSEHPLIQKVVQTDNQYTPLNLSEHIHEINTRPVTREISWQEKVLHGKYPKSLTNPNIDKEGSLAWLRGGYLHPETEGFMIAIQDEVIRTRNYEKHIMKINIEDRCRKCQSPNETIGHIIAGCPILANNAYLGRHNQVAKLIHSYLAQKYKLLGTTPPPYYKYDPKPVLESKEHLLYWDRPIITDRTVDHNRPDITLIDKRDKKAIIIDIACPLTHNITKTEMEKCNKYENLAEEIKRVWRVNNVDIIPIVISPTGVMSTNLKNNLRKLDIPEKLSYTIQKASILQTCHIVRKFLNTLR